LREFLNQKLDPPVFVLRSLERFQLEEVVVYLDVLGRLFLQALRECFDCPFYGWLRGRQSFKQKDPPRAFTGIDRRNP
jgi:hypothetical protein